MATTLNIQRFIRYVRQGHTPEPVSCTAMSACTQQAYNALLAASWTRVGDRESGLPRHNWAQTGFSNLWDAAKYCGDYADGYQHGYATAVCYTIRMPADALAGTTAEIESLAIPLHGDRWLADGCDISVTLSASATPPEWEATPDDAVTGQLAVVPSNTGSDTSAIVAFDWSAAPKTSLAYLHIVLKLTNYLTHRGAWIEGGAAIDGANIAVTFDRDVTPDASVEFENDAYRIGSGLFDTAPWSLYQMHSTVRFGPRSASMYSAETIDFYEDIVTMRQIPAFQMPSTSMSDDKYRGGVYLNVNGAQIPICVGFDRYEWVDGVTLVSTTAVASIFGRSVMTPEGYMIDAVSFGSDFPAPPAGLVLRMSFYGTSAYRGNTVASPTQEDYARVFLSPSKLAPSTAMTPAFWLGTAGSMTGISYKLDKEWKDDREDYSVPVAFPITPLLTFTTTTGYTTLTDKFYFDAPWAAPRHAMIILALSVDGCSAAPSPALTGAGHKYYGVQWFCPYLNFHLVKSVG